MRTTASSDRMSLRRLLPLTLTVVALMVAAVLVGCSQPSDTVLMENLAFKPQTITISAGTTVTWVNKDDTAHSTTSDSWKEGTSDPDAWNSGPLNPDQSFEFTFKNPGTYKYSCMVHPYMHGTVIVQ